MRSIAPVFALLVGLIALPAAAQIRIDKSTRAGEPPVTAKLPPGLNPETGARPGNEIGTGQSLPKSDKAGNIAPGNTNTAIP